LKVSGLLERKNWTEAFVNETAVFDIPPSFITGRINWLAEVKGEISTSGH